MLQRVAAVGSIDEKNARFAVMMRLPHQGIKELTCFNCFMINNWDASRFGFVHRALKILIIGVVDVWEFQGPILVAFYSFHEGVCDGYRNVKISDGVLIGLAVDKVVNIRVVHP